MKKAKSIIGFFATALVVIVIFIAPFVVHAILLKDSYAEIKSEEIH